MSLDVPVAMGPASRAGQEAGVGRKGEQPGKVPPRGDARRNFAGGKGGGDLQGEGERLERAMVQLAALHSHERRP